MYTRLLFLLLCSYAGIANAVTAVGRVATITVANNSFVELFQLDKPIENSPRCNESQRFSIHLQPPSGIAAYLALLAAKQQGYTVLNEGTNISSNECKSEDVRTITFNWPSTGLTRYTIPKERIFGLFPPRPDPDQVRHPRVTLYILYSCIIQAAGVCSDQTTYADHRRQPGRRNHCAPHQ